MRSKLSAFDHYLLTFGSGLRFAMGLYMVVQGLTRLVTGHFAAPINIFTAQVFGGIMTLVGVGLLLTVSARRRCGWPGRLIAIAGVTVWLFAIIAAWTAGSWVSISGVTVWILVLVNEVRIHEC